MRADWTPIPGGALDLLLWGGFQVGDWGALDHRAWAGAAEIGFQPTGMAKLRPWIRAGVFEGSGDDDPTDGTHGTFFPVLPTPRVYARFPFFNLMNLEDLFASLILRPGSRVTLRADARALGLSEPADLWYAGGGAYDKETFGFGGRPTGGAEELATLLDLSAEMRFTPRVTVTAYIAHADGGNVIERIYPQGSTARLGYLEIELRK